MGLRWTDTLDIAIELVSPPYEGSDQKLNLMLQIT